MDYIKTKVIADALGLSAQTVRRASKALGMDEKKQGKSFAFTRSEASAIAHFLRKRVADPQKASCFDAEVASVVHEATECDCIAEAEQEVASVASNAVAKVAVGAHDAFISIRQEDYVALVANASLADARKEMLDEKDRAVELLRQMVETREADISVLKGEVSALKGELSSIKSKRLSFAERIRGRLLLPPPR